MSLRRWFLYTALPFKLGEAVQDFFYQFIYVDVIILIASKIVLLMYCDGGAAAFSKPRQARITVTGETLHHSWDAEHSPRKIYAILSKLIFKAALVELMMVFGSSIVWRREDNCFHIADRYCLYAAAAAAAYRAWRAALGFKDIMLWLKFWFFFF